jgi:hypothetical protein
LVETCDPDRVACGNCAVLGFVIENEGEHAVEVLWRIDIKFYILSKSALAIGPWYNSSYQWDNNLTVRVCLEMVWVLQCLADDSVVVDFAIDSKGNALILVGKWLRSTVDTYDTQTLMSKYYEVLAIPLRSSCDYSRVLFAI